MLNEILNLDGAQELSKNQQKSVNGGKKCKTSVMRFEDDQFWEEAGQPRCLLLCRPSFLGIGLGSWSIENTNVPC
tara:strand:- start:151 stop:375 length:225 start_codon:yes stop_codon:yes gene_type:complete